MGGGVNQLSLILPGQLRIKKNSKRIFARGKFKTVLPSKAYEQWEVFVRAHFRYAHFAFKPLSCPCSVKALIYFKGPKPDLSGAMESIGDALEGLAWENDGLIESWDGSRLIHDLNDQRIEMVIEWN